MRSRALRLLNSLPSSPLRPSPTPSLPLAYRTAATTSSWKPKPRSSPRSPSSTKPLPITDTSTNPVDPQAAISSAPHVSEIDPSLSAQIPTPSSFTAALTTPAPGNTTPNGDKIDWASSFHGLSTVPFPPETAAVLMRPLDPKDVEIKPDGIIYLPEIKYRRILNLAFGPGGWGLAPRGELAVGEKLVTREYALVVHGRFIAEARGECGYFSEDTIPTAGEGCKSNALMRCCKDLGIASELWDPRYIREFKKTHAEEVWVEHVVNKKRRQIWKLKDADVGYPYTEVKKMGR